MAEKKRQLLSASMTDICHEPWKYAVEPFRVVGNVYFIGNSWVSIYLIDTGDGLLMIDTAMAQIAYLTMENIRKLGFDPHDVKWILLSHAHYDHCGGAAIFANYSGAKVYLGKEDMFMLNERPELIHAEGYFMPFNVDEHYVDNAAMQFGNVTVTAKHTPGHTPGCYSFFFDAEEDGELLRCGMHGGLGVNTLTKKYLTKYGLPMSNQQDFVDNLKRMREEKVDVPLGSHTNHGGMLQKAARIGEKPNPFIDREGFARVIDDRYQDFLHFCR